MHGEQWGAVLAAGAHVRTVRICRILASHVAHLAGQILHEGGRVEQRKLGRRHFTDAPATKWLGADAGTREECPSGNKPPNEAPRQVDVWSGGLPPADIRASSADSWTPGAERSGTCVTNPAREPSWRRSCWNACLLNPRLRADAARPSARRAPPARPLGIWDRYRAARWRSPPPPRSG